MMKRNRFLLGFVLALYIVPSILILSHSSLPLSAEENIGKDFTLASETWLSGFTYRKAVYINGSSGAGSGYPVNLDITYNSHMQSDFADIRFTDNDKETELDYWRETYTASTTASFWVEVSDNLDSDQIIYMYYGNTTVVSTTSEGADVFLFFDDFEDNNLNAWSVAQANWATQSTYAKYGTYAVFGDASATNRELYYNPSPYWGEDILIHAWVRFALDDAQEYVLYGKSDNAGGGGPYDIYPLASVADDWNMYDGVAWREYDTGTADKEIWLETEVAFDLTNNYWRFYLNGVEKQEWALKDGSGNSISEIQRLGSITATVAGRDTWFDDFYVRKWAYVEPELDYFGEENAVMWKGIDTATIRIIISPDTALLDALLILAGLILIPCSTLYLVKGGKENLSMDKVFFFVLMFMFGFALLIGGIM